MSQTTIIQPPETGAAPPEAARRFPGTKPRMLLIVNPWATSVSARLKNLVVYALRGRYDIEAVETQARNHATALTREAVGEGFDLVVSFGGDGTLNEAVNGLAGSDVPLSVLPGGCTNVVCRMLGIPTDVVDATEHLLQLADDLRPRRIDLGRVNGRYFVFSSGVGIDAEATDWVDAPAAAEGPQRRPGVHVRGACRASCATTAPGRRSMAVEVGGQRVEGVSAMVQNSDPYTYFRSRPLRLCEDISIDNGALSLLMMRRATTLDAPGVLRQLFSRNGRARIPPPRAQLHAGAAGARRVARRPAAPDGGGRRLHRHRRGVRLRGGPGALTVVA